MARQARPDSGYSGRQGAPLIVQRWIIAVCAGRWNSRAQAGIGAMNWTGLVQQVKLARVRYMDLGLCDRKSVWRLCRVHAPVAQLDRVPPSEGGGHRFESCRARHFPSGKAAYLVTDFRDPPVFIPGPSRSCSGYGPVAWRDTSPDRHGRNRIPVHRPDETPPHRRKW